MPKSTGAWRDQYDAGADQELASMQKRSDDDLLEAIRLGRTGEYFTIWKVIGSRPATSASCWTLISVLESDREYLDRYHCASALLRLLATTEFTPVQLSSGGDLRRHNVERMKSLVESLFGPRPLGR